MKRLRSAYVHRGDAARRRNRLKRIVAWGTVLAAALFVIANREASTSVAEAAGNSAGSSKAFRVGLMWQNRRLRREIANAPGDAALLRASLERNNRVIGYPAKYDIPANPS